MIVPLGLLLLGMTQPILSDKTLAAQIEWPLHRSDGDRQTARVGRQEVVGIDDQRPGPVAGVGKGLADHLEILSAMRGQGSADILYSHDSRCPVPGGQAARQSPEVVKRAGPPAPQARADADSKVPEPEQRVFIDCISRVLFLQDEFGAELAAVAGNEAVVGALTLGEVAGDLGGFLEFYNKTAVVVNLTHVPA